jgi:opacity protein-like surface antigen
MNAMNKLPLLLISLFVMGSVQINAQFGIRAGLNFSNLKFDDIQTSEYSISMLEDKKAGLHFGVFGKASLFGVYVMPEALLNTSKNTFEVEDLSTPGAENKVLEQKFTKLSIPVLVGKELGPLRLGIGPVATILLSSTSELADYNNYKEKFNTATFGFQVGAGLDIAFLALDVKYEGNLSKFGEGMNVGGRDVDFDSRESQFIVSVGYYF